MPVHPVAVKVRSVTPAFGSNALREHIEDTLELLAREIAITVRPLYQGKQLVLIDA
jgi:hypothetical protein